MDPALDPAVVEEAVADDPESAAAAYGPESRSHVTDFVAREVVRACTTEGLAEVLPARSQSYLAFVDPSRGSPDSMTLAIAHRRDDFVRVDAIREGCPAFNPEAVVDEFVSLLRTYGVGVGTGDRYAGEWPRGRFRQRGIEYRPSDGPKSDLYRDLLPPLNSRRVVLLDGADATVLAGLRALAERVHRKHLPGADAAGRDVFAETRIETPGPGPGRFETIAERDGSRRHHSAPDRSRLPPGDRRRQRQRTFSPLLEKLEGA